MTPKKTPRSGWRPWHRVRRMVAILVYDVLDAANLLGNSFAGSDNRRAATLRRGRRLVRLLAAPILGPLWAAVRLTSHLFMLVATFPFNIGRSLSTGFHEFLDNWGLLGDDINVHSGPRRRLLAGARYGVGFVLRIIPWLLARVSALLTEALYHLNLVNDGVDLRRVWTRTTTLFVLPALLGVTAAIGLGLRLASISPAELTLHYATAARAALESQDHVSAALWLARLIKLEPRQALFRYDLALVLNGQGQHARAQALMEELGPTDRPGYAPAHLWLARQLCAGPSATVGQLQAAWRHLSRVLHNSPHSDEAHALLARVLVSLGHLADAEKHLQHSAASDPEMRLLLAAVYAQQGKLDLSEHEAQLADASLSQRLDANHTLPLQLRLVDAKLLAGDFAGAEKVLAEIERDEPAATHLRRSQLYLTWYDALGRAGGDFVQRRELLERALDILPWYQPGLERLLELTQQSSAEAAWASSMLENLDWETAPGDAHVMVGLAEWKSGQSDAARQHLEAAYRLNPQDIRTVNNLAWILAHAQPPELTRALELVDQALARAPGQPNLLDTRGTILLQLHRWSDALGDLESLAAVRPQDKHLHAMLAQCYAELGMAELANFQRRLASDNSAPGAVQGPTRPAANKP